jgi:hypothetical protein
MVTTTDGRRPERGTLGRVTIESSPGRARRPGREERAEMQTKTWNIDVYLFEEDGKTHAEAVLRTHAGTELRHVGTAYKSPTDRDVPEIGDELAACRALNGLVHDLLDATIGDVQQNDPASPQPAISLG